MLQAIKDYENNKWKVIGQKVGKPAKVRETGSLVFSLSFFLLLSVPVLVSSDPDLSRFRAEDIRLNAYTSRASGTSIPSLALYRKQPHRPSPWTLQPRRTPSPISFPGCFAELHFFLFLVSLVLRVLHQDVVIHLQDMAISSEGI